MAVKMPDRPQKGRKIPSDYFLSMWDHQKSLELGGDLKTTTVTRTNAGTTVSANLGTQSGGGQRTYAYIAKITADNNDGTYDADEQENDAGTFQANTDEGLEFGSATNDIGYLYELNGLPGVPVGTFVVVHKTSDISGDPIWYFDGQQDAYGVAGSGAWVEITGHSSGAYSWKQKDPDATTDTVPAVTGANNAHTVNETEGIPNGTIVWLRFDGTDYRFEYDRLNFWAKITGESSGSYSWTELEGDATTTTTRTGTANAEEVSGRLGIPTNSIVYMVPNQIDSNEYKFEYHGANAGTLDTLDSGTSTTANPDTWARDSQGSDRGVDHSFVARLAVDSASGAVYSFCRSKTYDANGHLLTISAETRKTVMTLDPTAIDCSTELDPDDASISSDLLAWYKADALVGLSDGDAISSITDSSGNGNTVSQATGSAKAVYKTNIQNSLPAIRFDGTDDYYTGSLLAMMGAFTVIAVQNNTSASTGVYHNMDIDGSTQYAAGSSRMRNDIMDRCYNPTSPNYSGDVDRRSVSTTGLAIKGWTHDGSRGYSHWVDGVESAGGFSGNVVTFRNASELVIGATVDVPSGYKDFHDGDIFEVIFYDSLLSDEQIEQITCGLLSKWGI